MGSGKPRGIQAGRKLATKRRLQRLLYTYPDGLPRSTTREQSDLFTKIHSKAHLMLKD